MKCSAIECQRPYYAKGHCKLHYEHDRRDRGVPAMSRIHNSWTSMKQRCYYERSHNYPNYGARGIRVCDEWRNGFMSFYRWALANGYKDGLTLDRRDVNGDYEPDNCRWVSHRDQQYNRRNNRWLTIDGTTKSTNEWAKTVGLDPVTIRNRLFRGWDEKRAVFTRRLRGWD